MQEKLEKTVFWGYKFGMYMYCGVLFCHSLLIGLIYIVCLEVFFICYFLVVLSLFHHIDKFELVVFKVFYLHSSNLPKFRQVQTCSNTFFCPDSSFSSLNYEKKRIATDSDFQAMCTVQPHKHLFFAANAAIL
jgi:hypothetical protein